MTATEGKLISQETLQTTFQLHTPRCIKEPTKNPVTWPTQSQLFITLISTSVQPKRNFYNGTTDRAIWASRKFNWSLQENSTGVHCQHRSNQKSSYLCMQLTTYPLCAACQFGKQRQRPSPGKRTSVVKDVQGNLKKGKLIPGQCIAVDHNIWSTKGRLFTSRTLTCILEEHSL